MSAMLVPLAVPGTFGALDQELLRQVTSRFSGIRVDVHPGDAELHHEQRWEQVLSIRDSRAFAIFLIGPDHIDLGDTELVQKSKDFATKLVSAGYRKRGNAAVEIGNEPDLAVSRWKRNPEAMARCFAECYDAVKELVPELPVLCPSVSNLNSRGLGYLSKMVPQLPPECGVAFHRYPAGVDFETSHRGYSSRFDEVDRLRELAGGRELWNTETGWAEQNRDYTLSELQVAERMEREHELWTSLGFRSWVP